MIKLVVFDLWNTLTFNTGPRIEVFPHAVPMLKKIRKQGIRTGLITNSGKFGIRQIKKSTKILENIDFPIFSFETGLSKPDTRLFKEILKRAKCAPGEAVMVGDKLIDDIAPAKIVGMNAIQFTTYENLKKELKKFAIDLE